jgi:hexulose-6-phosphate isomerase
MLKGIYHGSFPDHLDLETVLMHTAKAGFDSLEFRLRDQGVGPTMQSTDAEIEAIARMGREYGIQFRSLSCAIMWENSLSSADAEERERGRRIVLRQLEIAKILGADTILVVPAFVKDDEQSYDACYKRSQEELAKILPEAEKLGIYVGVENVWNKFLLSPLEMARYVDELGSPYAGVYFDVGNVLNFGFPEQWIRILGKRIKKVHLKDFKTSTGNITGFVPLLSGNVNWPSVVAALREIGYDDTLTAEMSPYVYHPLQAVYDTARHIDVILGGEPK